mmetsp:Transcript_3132/g.5290  ORF Transcript_3132/g.5290 Transcript_3132/m.5290 type:complete len:251 (-) Transcript_3132:283-1035(-)
MQRTVHTDVPHLECTVASRACHVMSSTINGQRSNNSFVAQHLHNRLVHIRCPEADRPVGVSQVHHCVPGVCLHAITRAKSCWHLSDISTGRHVDVPQYATRSSRCEHPVIAKVLHYIHMRTVVSKAMQFRSSGVVDIQILVLRDSKHGMIAQEGNVANCLSDLNLVKDLEAVPLCNRDMPLSTAEQESSAISGKRCFVWAELLKLDVVCLSLGLHINSRCQLLLGETPGAFHSFCLKVASVCWQQDLRLG